MNSQKLKYVKLISGEVIIFPMLIEHDTFKHLQPVTAGFLEISENKVTCYGESFSLKLKANKEKDSLDATKQVFGVDAMIELLNENMTNSQ